MFRKQHNDRLVSQLSQTPSPILASETDVSHQSGAISNGDDHLSNDPTEPGDLDDSRSRSLSPRTSMQPSYPLEIDSRPSNANSELEPGQYSDSKSHLARVDQSDSLSIEPPVTEHLMAQLRGARIEWPHGSHRFFIPQSCKTEFITEEAVAREVFGSHPLRGPLYAKDCAKKVLAHLVNFFAILAYMGKGGEICAILEEEITDKHLPLKRCDESGRSPVFSLQTESGQKLKLLEAWSPNDLETFDRIQWFLLAPVFEDKEHYELHRNCVLPFIDCTPLKDDKKGHSSMNASGGGYSDVSKARIHPVHHRFHAHLPFEEDDQKVAIKQLHSTDEDEFEKERSILTMLGTSTNSNPHLVKLLATFEKDKKYHLIFPLAKCNLRKFWEKNPKPDFSPILVLWSLKQMVGMAGALNIIHNFRVTVPLGVEGGVRYQKKAMLKVKEHEELYGRHGDMKPENILFFPRIPELPYDGQGVLQIADFGLGRFHGRDSKTEPWPHNVRGSPTYEPPECQLHRSVSRKYDLWSLGCIYLEFATWLLQGNEDIETFSKRRGRKLSLNPNFSDDYFFTITRDKGGEAKDAKVREGVHDWVKRLHRHERCSQFIHDLLDLIMGELLVIKAEDRIETPHLYTTLKGIQTKAESQEEYLCKANPYPPASVSAAVRTRSPNSKTVSFADIARNPTWPFTEP